MAGEQFTDAQVANMVRMLMRDQLDHEMVCVVVRDRINSLSASLASAEERAAKAEQEPVCADPSAPLASCVYCNGVVHTCEKAEGPDYRCPAHPNEREDDGEWFCSETCWYEDALARLIAQRDDLASTVAGLRGALEEADKHLPTFCNSKTCIAERCIEARAIRAKMTAALAASPAEHAARIQAAALRDAATEVQSVTDSLVWHEATLHGRQSVIDRLLEMADRLEKAVVK